jgi:hypothetical protein
VSDHLGPKPSAESRPRRLLVHTIQQGDDLMVSLWVNNARDIVGCTDIGDKTRDELYREVGEIVVNQGLGKKQGYQE